MRHSCSLVLLAALLSSGPAFTQTASSAAITESAVAAPVAHVYIGTTEGVVLYNAASDGKLTMVEGSPFHTSGLAIGSNGKYFITLGTEDVRSYPVASNGAIERQESEINTQEFDGKVCGNTGGAVLDHSGHTVHVLLNTAEDGGSGLCAAYQSFNISSSGALTFSGDTIIYDRYAFIYHLPTFTANDMFAYAQIGDGGGSDVNPYVPGVPIGFKRESSSALESFSFNATLPPAGAIGDYYTLIPTAGISNDLAISLLQAQLPYGETGPIQLGSFTVDSKGNISTTNTWKDMPTPGLVPQILNMSPTGELLAVAGNGLQIFHFNGPEPITHYSAVLIPTVPIGRIHWDKDNHLYALSESRDKLYVYTVTPTSITEAPGSPYTIAGPNALAVVPVR